MGEFRIESGELNVGDKVIITGPTTGVVETEVKEIRVEMKSVQTAAKGVYCSIQVPSKIRRADKIYKVVDAKLIKQ